MEVPDYAEVNWDTFDLFVTPFMSIEYFDYSLLKNMFCVLKRTISFKCFLVPRTLIETVHEISNNVACASSKASDQPAQTHSLIRAIASRLSIL